MVKITDTEAANISNGTNIFNFKDVLEIEYLTVEQRDAFLNDQKFAFINGPAGAGKTGIMLAKIIQLVK